MVDAAIPPADAARRGIATVPARTVDRLGIGVVVLSLVVPVLAVALSRTDRTSGDVALIELRTRDVLSTHPPMLGAYSRYGWDHPGPALFYVLALPYRILGNDGDALRLAVLLLNTVGLVALAWLLHRRGRTALVLGLAGTAALVWGQLPHALSDGWNVTVTMIPFVLTVVACWCSLCGDRGALLLAALSFAFVFQAHVGVGIVLGPAVVVTILCRVRSASRSDEWRTTHRLSSRVWWSIGAVVLVVAPVIVDTVWHFPGNLERIVHWSLTNDEPQVGWADGLRLIGRTSSISFPFHPQYPNQFFLSIMRVTSGVLPGTLLVLLVLGLVLARRHRWRAEAQLCTIVLLVWIGGTVAAASIALPLGYWLIDWLQPLGWVTWTAVVIVGVRWASTLVVRRVGDGVVTVAMTIGLVVGTVVYSRAEADTPYSSAAYRRPIDQLVSAAIGGVDRGAPIRIESAGESITANTVLAGIVVQLDRSGFEMCVLPELRSKYGGNRVCSGRADVHLLLRSEQLAEPPPDGATTLAVSDPLTAAQRAEADDITGRLTELLVSSGLDDQVGLLTTTFVGQLLAGDPPAAVVDERTDIERLQELREVPGQRYGLYLVPG